MARHEQISTTELTKRLLRAEPRALARTLTAIERRSPGVDALLASLHEHTGNAHVVGITGPAGSGKSTLVAALTRELRARNRTVGILAVDPSSHRSGGAILGDRIRMSESSTDPGVYIRSLATRDAVGGLSRAVLDGAALLDAAGKDVVIVETVGAGQAEVDVINVADTVVVVSIPGAGDHVQAMKGGLLEIADVHVVNKSDRPGAQQTAAEIRNAISLSVGDREGGEWDVPVQQTIASTGSGVSDIVHQLDEHLVWMLDHGTRAERARHNATTRIRWAAEELVLHHLRAGVDSFDAAVAEVAGRRTDPVRAARDLLRTLSASLAEP